MNTNTTSTPNQAADTTTNPSHTDAKNENRWVARLEELMNVKNVDDLKSELTKIATEIQKEIQSFDLNEHLSPEAKSRLKMLEQRYSEVTRSVQKAQRQFDREFNKSLRILKRTRQDAEKQLKGIKAKITKHRGTIAKASVQLKKKLNTGKKKKVVSKKRTDKKPSRKTTK